MLFQTYGFLLFFLVVCIVCFLARGKARQICLLAASIFYYAWGSLTHIPLFVCLILWAYLMGRVIGKNPKRWILAVSVVMSLLPLVVCKYVPFLTTALFPTLPQSLTFIQNLSLPLGISFYTFQAIGYLVDVYRKKLPAERDVVVYGLFVAFFPQLLSGPIGRAPDLIRQLKENRGFSYDDAAVGLRMMALGLFLKVFAADTIGYVVDNAYNNLATTSGVMLLAATFLFGIQIYCDFNGYTIIARGVARVLGIRLINNFEHPYMSRSVTEFWRTWHRSLSFWFRDYVYFPLGGSRCGRLRASFNLFITFLLSGVWHGANWTFAIWGALNGLYLIVEKPLGLAKKDKHGASAFFGWLYTYLVINFAWIFFRADSIADAGTVISKIFTGIPAELGGSTALSAIVPLGGMFAWKIAMSVAAIAVILLLALYERKKGGELAERLSLFPAWARWTLYLGCLFVTLGFGVWGTTSQFIYFRF